MHDYEDLQAEYIDKVLEFTIIVRSGMFELNKGTISFADLQDRIDNWMSLDDNLGVIETVKYSVPPSVSWKSFGSLDERHHRLSNFVVLPEEPASFKKIYSRYVRKFTRSEKPYFIFIKDHGGKAFMGCSQQEADLHLEQLRTIGETGEYVRGSLDRKFLVNHGFIEY